MHTCCYMGALFCSWKDRKQCKLLVSRRHIQHRIPWISRADVMSHNAIIYYSPLYTVFCHNSHFMDCNKETAINLFSFSGFYFVFFLILFNYICAHCMSQVYRNQNDHTLGYSVYDSNFPFRLVCFVKINRLSISDGSSYLLIPLYLDFFSICMHCSGGVSLHKQKSSAPA